MKTLSKLFAGFALAVFATAFLTSCGSKQDSPEAVAQAAVEYLKNKDIDGYFTLFASPDKSPSDEDKAMLDYFKSKMSQALDKKNGINSYEIVDQELNDAGDKAKVKVKITYGDGSEKNEKMKMEKKDGKWWLTM